MKAVNAIPPTHGHYVQWAAIKLAGVWWKQGWLPEDVGDLAKLISTRKRTLAAHLDEVKQVMHTYFLGMIEARPEVVATRQRRQESGARGGVAAKAPAAFPDCGHFLEAEQKLPEQEVTPDLEMTDMSWVIRQSLHYRR